MSCLLGVGIGLTGNCSGGTIGEGAVVTGGAEGRGLVCGIAGSIVVTRRITGARNLSLVVNWKWLQSVTWMSSPFFFSFSNYTFFPLGLTTFTEDHYTLHLGPCFVSLALYPMHSPGLPSPTHQRLAEGN